ncbi:MAG: peptidoglycan-associated lipoprotein Pal [Gammaproteobacteria bacterium]
MKQMMKWGIVLLSAALIAGCANKGTSRSGSGMGSEDGSAVSTGVSEGSYWGEDLSGMSEEELLQRQVFYFDLDSSTVNQNYDGAIKAHAGYLSSHPNAKVRLEGHTDERGSSEYNIALGERRAKSVESMMVSDGANPSQIAVVSYGKEKPAVQGHDESAWRYNRRVVIVYEAK